MRLFGLDIRISKAVPAGLQTVGNRGGWLSIVREAFAGAWQRNIEWTTDTVIAFGAINTCITLIAQDFGKLRPKLIESDGNGIWDEVTNPAYSPVLRKPNRYQTRNQFQEWWMTSKLVRGNTYALKQRDARGVVIALYLLDPSRVTVLVAPDGSVFYQLAADNLSGLKEPVTVPSSEIIHDRMNCLFHPLVGTSPIFACGMAANIGLKIQGNSAHFFAKGTNPSGVITCPTNIEEGQAKRLQGHWEKNFSGDHAGAVAVLGNNMKFESMRMSSVDAQVVEHLKWTAEACAAVFHVPAFKAGIGTAPTYTIDVLNGIYYSDCLQAHIESFESVMDQGLGLSEKLGIELDLDGLLRMDNSTLIKSEAEAVAAGIKAPNESRKRLNLKPVKGGNTPYLQQQYWSLAALDGRGPAPNASGDRRAPAPPIAPPEPPAAQPAKSVDDVIDELLAEVHKQVDAELVEVG